jgi:outer membrane protein TolC
MAPRMAWAQAVQPPASAAAPMTLAQAVQRGRAKRLSVRIADAEVEAARARVGQARALNWPTLDLTAKVSDTHNYDSYSGVTASVMLPGSSVPSTIDVTSTVPRYQTSSALEMRYPLYTGGRIKAQLTLQEQALLAAEVKRSIAVRDVALDIAQAYFKLRSACIKRDAAQRRAEGATEDLRRAQQRLRDGRIAEIELNEAELAQTETQVDLRSRGEDLQLAQADFIASQSEISGKTNAIAPNCNFTSQITSELAWIEALADATLETKYNQLQVRIAEKNVQVESAARSPQLNVTAQYAGVGRSGVSSGGSSGQNFSDAFNSFGRQLASVGVDFSVKLFDGGLTRDRIAEAQAEVKRLNLVAQSDAGQRKQARQRDQLRVRIAQGRVELARARFELAQKQSAIARERQNSGSGSTVTVEEQSERMYNAQDEYRLAELDLALARIAALLPSSRIQPGTTTDVPDINHGKEKTNHG